MIVLGLLVAGVVLLAWPRRRCLSMAVPDPGESPNPLRTRVIGRIRRRNNADAVTDQLVLMLESVSAAIRAGVTPAAAVASAARACAASIDNTSGHARPLRELASVADRGDDLGAAWRDLRIAGAEAALGQVARAWTLSDKLGCGLTDSIDATVTLLRADLERHRRMESALAGPRATMQILTLLPVAGVGIAAVIGVPPWQLYSGLLGQLVLGMGLVLVLGGRRITRFMAERASAPTVVRSS